MSKKWLSRCPDCGRIIIQYDGSHDRPKCPGVRDGKRWHDECVFIMVGDTICREYTKYFPKTHETNVGI